VVFEEDERRLPVTVRHFMTASEYRESPAA
jgi:hypothetical protein